MAGPQSGTVTGRWLADHLDEVTVADTRWYLDGRQGSEAYEQGHIPGAVFVDIDQVLADPASSVLGRHPLPGPERFAEALGELGIAEDRLVVAYDDAGGSVAARLWWLLRAIGQPAAVLDGGINAWPGELTTEIVAPVSVPRRPRPWPPERFLTADDVEQVRKAPDALLIDARASARYEAGDPAIDPRAGHIPGARSAPWPENLGPNGGFRSADELRERFGALGATTESRVVAYCGSGVTACHDLLALELAGFTDTALFTGSWSAWGADASRPAEVGPDPGRRTGGPGSTASDRLTP
jgi:thiosulfate/3-mercaptopyruvate sulfurtransferase